MAHAQRKMDYLDTVTLDREAQNRVDQVRLRQMAFRVKEAYPKLQLAHIEAVAMALIHLFDEGKTPTLADLRDRLVQNHGEPYAEAVVAEIVA